MPVFWTTSSHEQRIAEGWLLNYATFGVVASDGRTVVALADKYAHEHPGKIRSKISDEEWRRAICPDIHWPPKRGEARTDWVGGAKQLAKSFVPALQAADEVIKARLAICETCPHWHAAKGWKPDGIRRELGRCRLCGCAYKRKVSLAGESCPDNPPRWRPVRRRSGIRMEMRPTE